MIVPRKMAHTHLLNPPRTLAVPHASHSFIVRCVGGSFRRSHESMPSGLQRYQLAESPHLVPFSCCRRLPFLLKTGAREALETALETVRARQAARMYAYALMAEHVHLPMNEALCILVPQFIKVLKQTASRNLKGDRVQFCRHR